MSEAKNRRSAFVCEPANNGGWIILEHDRFNTGLMPMTLGAYTNAADMIADVQKMLLGSEPEDKS